MNRTEKKLLSLVLCILFLFGVIPAAKGNAETVVDSGDCGDSLTWTLYSDGKLVIEGTGEMGDYWSDSCPWGSPYDQRSRVRSVEIRSGVTSIGNYAFYNCRNLTSVTLPQSLRSIRLEAFDGCSGIKTVTIPEGVTSIGQEAFANCSGLKNVVIPSTVRSIGGDAFKGCTALQSAVIPEGVTSIESGAFYGCSAMSSLTIPSTVTSIGSGALAGCWELASITLPAGVTSIGMAAFQDCRFRDIYYGGTRAQRTAVEVGWSTECNDDFFNATWHYAEGPEPSTPPVPTPTPTPSPTPTPTPTPATGFVIETGVEAGSIIEIEGVSCTVGTDGRIVLDRAPTEGVMAVTYTYNQPGIGIHGRYPDGMKVYRLTKSGSDYTLTYIPELDNVLQYSGSSIRITGNRGIRMITSIPTDKKRALTSTGLAGYTLLEYGTVVAWADELGGANLTLKSPGAKSACAYKKGVSDPVFAQKNGLTQYTNVLVGFSAEQCAPDLVMRPYIILQASDGARLTFYGGAVSRSIGYIAYQNRNAFAPGTDAYNFIWGLIHAAYGSAYDVEYR